MPISGTDAQPTVSLSIARVVARGAMALCYSQAGQTVILPRASMPRPGDQLSIVLETSAQSTPGQTAESEPIEGTTVIPDPEHCKPEPPQVPPWAPAEFCLTRPADRRATVIHTRVGYVPLPRPDKNGDPGVRISLDQSRLNLKALYLPCPVIRDYFFVPDRGLAWNRRRTLYQELGVSQHSTFADLSTAFRVKRLELARQKNQEAVTALERVYNLLAIPPLRAAYDELLLDSDRPIEFPGAGFGTLLVGGIRRANTFFVERILSFRPDRTRQTFAVPFRKIEFCASYAVIHDSRKKKEVFLDPHSLTLQWDLTWNQWRQFIGRRIQISAECIRTGRFQKTAGAWDYSDWYTALPSRTTALIPDELRNDIENAQKAHQRLGRFQSDIEVLREIIRLQPTEAKELKRLCWDRGLPGDFDIRLVIWKPEFEQFYYEKLKRQATSTYLWRTEFIFELEHTVIAEIPQTGRASYIFKRPPSLEAWLSQYTRTSRADIRKNRANIAESLGFIGRVVHGKKPQNWWKDILVKTGESMTS